MITKEEVFEKIKAGVAKDSQLSDRSINEILDNILTLVPVAEDTELDAYVEQIAPFYKTMAGQVRFDVAAALKKVKDADPQDPPEKEKGDPPKNDNNPPEWEKKLSALDEKLNALLAKGEKQATADKAKTTAFENVKKLYPENVIKVAAYGFDFGEEGAVDIFTKRVGDIASELGIAPEKAKPTDASALPDTSALDKELETREKMTAS